MPETMTAPPPEAVAPTVAPVAQPEPDSGVAQLPRMTAFTSNVAEANAVVAEEDTPADEHAEPLPNAEQPTTDEPSTGSYIEPGQVDPTDSSVAEAQQSHEEDRQVVQGIEMQQVTSATLQREIQAINDALPAMTVAQRTQMFTENPGKSALWVLHILQDDPTRFKVNEAFDIATENGTMRVTSATYTNDEAYTCIVEGQTEPTVISRQTIINAHMVAESDVILSQFPEGSAQRVLLEMQIERLKNPDAALPVPGSAESEALDRAILKAADANAMLTVNDLRGMQAGVEPSRQAAFAKLVETASQQGNLLPPDVFIEALAVAGMNPAEMLQSTNETIQKLREDLTKNPEDAVAKADLFQAELKIRALAFVSQAFAENGLLEQFMEQTRLGTVDLQRAKALKEGIRTGNLDAIVEAIPGVEKVSKEVKEKLQKAIEAIGKKKGTSIWAIIFALAFSMVGNVTDLTK